MTRRIARIFTLLLFVPFAAMAQSSPENVAQLLTLIGFDETFEDTRENVISMVEGGQIPPATKLASVWPVAAAQHFDSDKMLAGVTTRLARLLSTRDVDNLRELYATDFALKITEIEEREQNNLPFDQIAQKGAAIAVRLKADDPARLEQYFKLIDAVGTLQSTVTTVMNMQYAFLTGASLTGMLPVPLSDEQIVQRLNAIEPQLRRDMLNNILAVSAYIYRDLSDAELAQYIEFLSIPEVSRMYGFLDQVSGEVLSREYAAFALKLGEIAPQSEL